MIAWAAPGGREEAAEPRTGTDVTFTVWSEEGGVRRLEEGGLVGVGVSKNGYLLQIFNFAKFWRARSRLCQNEILQESMRLTAFFKQLALATFCIILQTVEISARYYCRFQKGEYCIITCE